MLRLIEGLRAHSENLRSYTLLLNGSSISSHHYHLLPIRQILPRDLPSSSLYRLIFIRPIDVAPVGGVIPSSDESAVIDLEHLLLVLLLLFALSFVLFLSVCFVCWRSTHGSLFGSVWHADAEKARIDFIAVISIAAESRQNSLARCSIMSASSSSHWFLLWIIEWIIIDSFISRPVRRQ